MAFLPWTPELHHSLGRWLQEDLGRGDLSAPAVADGRGCGVWLAKEPGRFGLSQTFNRFCDQLPVLKAPAQSRATGLALCRLSAQTIRLGLALLGIKTLDRM